MWSATYSSFGDASIEIETVENNLRYPGQYFDAETGLHYNYFRYYNPAIGRYFRNDPLGINAGFNYYIFSRNNPVVNFDSDGLFCKTTLSFTVPKGTFNTGSKLYSESKWKSTGLASPIIAISPSKIFSPFQPHGLAKCGASRRLIYEDSFEKRGIKVEIGYCFDYCQGFYFWSDINDILISGWTEKRTEFENKREIIRIWAATGQLAAIECANWVNTLNN